jgi:hypothetical protein
MCLAFIGFDLWFHTEAHRAEDEVQLHRRFDSEDTVWFVALAKEQLALVTQYEMSAKWVVFENGWLGRTPAAEKRDWLASSSSRVLFFIGSFVFISGAFSTPFAFSRCPPAV